MTSLEAFEQLQRRGVAYPTDSATIKVQQADRGGFYVEVIVDGYRRESGWYLSIEKAQHAAALIAEQFGR